MHRDSGKSKTRQGQSTPPHVRFYANDWFTGVAALKADERGVYISICVHIWTTGQRVPLDDAEAARRLCLQFNLYQRVRDKLLRLEKITKNIDGYGNHRAETELDRATNARSEAGNGVPTDSRPDARNGYDGRPEPDVAGCSKQGGAPTHSASGSTVDAHAATDSALLGAHGGACQGDPMGACQGEDEKTESNQSPSIEPRTKNQ